MPVGTGYQPCLLPLEDARIGSSDKGIGQVWFLGQVTLIIGCQIGRGWRGGKAELNADFQAELQTCWVRLLGQDLGLCPRVIVKPVITQTWTSPSVVTVGELSLSEP